MRPSGRSPHDTRMSTLHSGMRGPRDSSSAMMSKFIVFESVFPLRQNQRAIFPGSPGLSSSAEEEVLVVRLVVGDADGFVRVEHLLERDLLVEHRLQIGLRVGRGAPLH